MAAMLVALPITSGLGASPSLAADLISPAGGCWAYVPDVTATDDADGADPLFPPVVGRDISTELQPWGVGDPVRTSLSLEISDETQVSGMPGYLLSLKDGPVVIPLEDPSTPRAPEESETSAPTEVKATALFSVLPAAGLAANEAPQLVRSPTSLIDVLPGAPIEELKFEAALPASAEGRKVLRLDTLVFEVPGDVDGAPGSVLVCNGQTKAQPSFPTPADPEVPDDQPVPGINPATTPVPTEATAEFTATSVRSVTVAGIRGQAVTSAARAGDVLELRVAGLAPEAAFTAQLCDAQQCTDSAPGLVTDATGGATTTLTVPESSPRGNATVRIASGGATPLEIGFVVLGSPTVVTSEEAGDESVAVTIEGADWDPTGVVKIKGLVDGGSMSAQQGVSTEVAADGSFSTTFEVTDPQTTRIRVRQQRAAGFEELVLRQDLDNQVPGGTAPPPANKVPPGAVTPPGGAVPPVTAPVVPPVSIPVPAEVPVTKVDAPPAPEVTTEEMKISEVRLDGEPSLGELFGGASRREVVFLVENTGSGVVTNPLVRLGVGRDSDVDPVIVAAEVGDLQPGARVVVSVDVALPMASFGTYQVVGQVGDAEETRFTLEWQTYPWGLIALNIAGLALLVWGVRRRQRSRTSPAPFLAQGDEEEAGASVIDITALDEWWEHGRVARRVTVEPDDNDSIVDLDAAERWWSRRDDKVS